MKRLILASLLVLCLASSGWAETYFVSYSDGSDSDTGKTAALAWKTIGKVNGFAFAAGDDIYFKCGDTWSGTVLGIDWSGVSASNRTVIGAYFGSGTIVDTTNRSSAGPMPIIYGGQSGGLPTVPTQGSFSGLVHVGKNMSHVSIENLDVQWSGGIGIDFNGGTGNRAIRCTTSNTYRGGIRFNGSTYQAIDSLAEYNEVSLASLSRTVNINEFAGSIVFIGGNATPYNTNGIARYNYVHNCYGEGIGFYKGNDHPIAEYNTVVLTKSASIYFDRSSLYGTARYNLVYGYPGGAHSSKTAISQQDEAAAGYAGTIGTKIYGNMIAYTEDGIGLRAQQTGSFVKDVVVANNIIIDALGGCFNSLQPATSFLNTKIKNNICWKTGLRTGVVLVKMPATTDAQIEWGNNFWSADPGSEVKDDTDIKTGGTYANGDPLLNDSTVSWNALTLGKLTGQEFALLSSSIAVNAGEALGSPYDQILNLNNTNFKTGCGPTGNGASSFSLVTQSDYGAAEVGADVYVTSGSVPSVPAGFSLSEATQNTLKAKWTASTPTVATSYQIKYGPSSTWEAQTGTTTVSGITTTEYTITGLTAETEYSAYVLGTNSTGNSAYSTADSETTLAAEVTGTVLSENCTSLADSVVPALTGLIDWTADGRCAAADAHDTNYAKMAYTVTGGLPTEYTVALEDVTFTKIPSTYLAGTTGYRIYMWFANGATRLAVAFAADGIYLKDSNNADVLIPNTASYVTTDANQDWDIIVKDDPDSVYNLVTIYKNGTVIPEIVDHLAGDDYALYDGLVTVEAYGVSAAANDTEWSFDALTITSGLVYPKPPPAVTHTSAYFATGGTADIKTGTSTITVVDGVGTFSVAQIDAALDRHAAKGMEVSFGSTPTKCYVSSRMSQAQYTLVDADGDACANATGQTVNSFGPSFTGFANALANMDEAGYLTSGDLGTLDVDVNLYLGDATEIITTDITIGPFSNMNAEDCFRVYGSSAYTISADGTTALTVANTHVWLYDLQITHTAVDAMYQRSIKIDFDSSSVFDIRIINPKLRGYYATNTDRHEGIGLPDLEAEATSKLYIINADISGYNDGDGTTGYGINIADADCTVYIYRATITRGDVGILGNGATVCKNCLVNTNNSFSGTFNETLSTNNLSDDDDAPGVSPINASVTFNDAAALDFTLHPTDDHLFFDDGIDLSEDNIFPVTTDRVGTLLTTPFSVGAYAAPNPGDIVKDLVTDLTYSGYSYGTSTITFHPTYSVAGDSCVWTEGETTLYTDDGVDAGDDETACNNTAVEIELAPGSHTILLTASKATYDDDTATVTVVMLNERGTFYAGAGEGCTTADPTSSNKPTVELDPGTIIILCGTQATFDMSSQPTGIFYLHGDDWSGGTFTGTSSHIIMPASTLSEDSSGLKVMNFTGKNIKFSNVTISGGKAVTTTP